MDRREEFDPIWLVIRVLKIFLLGCESPEWNQPSLGDEVFLGNSMAVQWLGLWAFTAEGPGLIPGRGTKIPRASYCAKKKKRKETKQTKNALMWISIWYWPYHILNINMFNDHSFIHQHAFRRCQLGSRDHAGCWKSSLEEAPGNRWAKTQEDAECHRWYSGAQGTTALECAAGSPPPHAGRCWDLHGASQPIIPSSGRGTEFHAKKTADEKLWVRRALGVFEQQDDARREGKTRCAKGPGWVRRLSARLQPACFLGKGAGPRSSDPAPTPQQQGGLLGTCSHGLVFVKNWDLIHIAQNSPLKAWHFSSFWSIHRVVQPHHLISEYFITSPKKPYPTTPPPLLCLRGGACTGHFTYTES